MRDAFGIPFSSGCDSLLLQAGETHDSCGYTVGFIGEGPSRVGGEVTDAKAARRMLAIALVMEGSDRAAAARSCGMDRQALRDWVYRYNAGGLAGLSNHTAPGRTPYLSAAQKAELSEIVRAGPDPEVDRVVRWRRIDLKHLLKERFGVVMHERTVGKQLAELGFRRLSVRPAHPQSDPAAQAAFKKKLRAAGSGGTAA